jgi:hypothetical protein
VTTTAFPPNSRYHGVETVETVAPDGRTVVHLRRRLIPPLEAFDEIDGVVVQEGDRPDLVAARVIGDPEQYWRLADANGVTWPAELTAEPGRRLRVTLPQGLRSARDA